MSVQLDKVNAELQEARALARAHRQQISALMVEEQSQQHALSTLDARMHQVHAMADEHA